MVTGEALLQQTFQIDRKVYLQLHAVQFCPVVELHPICEMVLPQMLAFYFLPLEQFQPTPYSYHCPHLADPRK